jgi:phosphate transport system substrate-binding protein
VRPLVLALLFACAAPLVALADGPLTVAGSTTLLPLLRDAAQAYQGAHPGVSIAVSGGGSRAALAQLANKQIDMAASDVASEPGGDLVDHRIAVIAFALATDPHSGVTTLTREQARDVLSGRITNWKDAGGSDLPIVVINRPAGSGVGALIRTRLMGKASFAASAAEEEATSSLVADLHGVPGAVGYGALAGLRDQNLTLLGIDGIAPTDANVESGAYTLWAYEYVVTSGPATPEMSRFLAFLTTNRALLRAHGYLAVPDMQQR